MAILAGAATTKNGLDERTRQTAALGKPRSKPAIKAWSNLCGFPLYAEIFFPRYHNESEIDHEGEDLPDKYAAWHEATVMAGQMLQSLDGKLQPDREWRMEVTDEFANTLYVLHINAEKVR